MVLIEAQACDLPCIASAAVPKEAKVLSTMKFMPETTSPGDWADAVLKNTEINKRYDTAQEMRKAGFDIEAEAQKLMERYDNLLADQ